MALNAKCLRVSCVIIAIGWIIGTIFTASYLVQAGVTAISIFVIYEYYGYLRNKIRYNDE
ncbi:GL20088 [Drosophila persimilis]|uniref:GL20088 n=1 Tax=Drosophila persimilis TaxID=7234 RepID=B4H8G6_DROPE|nr:GL20088 [Drosophila persimilis]